MRAVHLLAVAGLAMAATSPARAADVRTWFVDLKRTAKDLRIAAAAGNEAAIGGLRAWAHDAAYKAGMWPMGEVPQAVAVACRDASNMLLEAARAAETGAGATYRQVMARYPAQEEACFLAFTRTERRS